MLSEQLVAFFSDGGLLTIVYRWIFMIHQITQSIGQYYSPRSFYLRCKVPLSKNLPGLTSQILNLSWCRSHFLQIICVYFQILTKISSFFRNSMNQTRSLEQLGLYFFLSTYRHTVYQLQGFSIKTITGKLKIFINENEIVLAANTSNTLWMTSVAFPDHIKIKRKGYLTN